MLSIEYKVKLTNKDGGQRFLVIEAPKDCHRNTISKECYYALKDELHSRLLPDIDRSAIIDDRYGSMLLGYGFTIESFKPVANDT